MGGRDFPPSTLDSPRTNLADSHTETNNLQSKVTNFPMGIPILRPWAKDLFPPRPTRWPTCPFPDSLVAS